MGGFLALALSLTRAGYVHHPLPALPARMRLPTSPKAAQSRRRTREATSSTGPTAATSCTRRRNPSRCSSRSWRRSPHRTASCSTRSAAPVPRCWQPGCWAAAISASNWTRPITPLPACGWQWRRGAPAHATRPPLPVKAGRTVVEERQHGQAAALAGHGEG